MKKIIYILLSATVLFCSCSDYLDTKSGSSIEADDYYTSEDNMDKALTGVYGCLKPFSKYYFVMAELRSDNMFETAESKKNEYADCAQFNSTGLLNDNIVYNCWADHYKLIVAANTLIDNLGKVTFKNAKTRTQYEAEARFLRALAYFDLVRFYGRVPVALHATTIDETFAIGQSEAIETYKTAIIPDLLFATDSLQEKALDYLNKEHAERVTKMAANALLGKVLVQMAGHPVYASTVEVDGKTYDVKQEAKECLKEVLDYAGDIASPQHYWASTIDEWNLMWLHEKDNKYHIFEIQYACAPSQGNPVTPLSKTSNSSADNYCNASLTNGSHFYVERQLLEHFIEPEGDTDEFGLAVYKDKRLRGTVDLNMSYDEETGTYSEGTANANHWMIRFFEHKMKRSQLGYSDMDADIVNYTYWPQNFPVLRIEDVALLYAELAGKTEGTKYLNWIRNRAGLPSYYDLSDAAFQEAVKDERRYELIGEGHRWFDEVRHNTFVDDIQGIMQYYHDNYDSNSIYITYKNRVTQNGQYYPIPLSQMRVKEGLYQQNPGY